MGHVMTEQGQGTIVTFYSFKGGTGRTTALANTAWILASAGYRVLVVDWDLESPGLHRFFEPFLDAETVADNSGVIDMVKDYQWAVSRDPGLVRDEERLRTHARVGAHVIPLDWQFPNGGSTSSRRGGRTGTTPPTSPRWTGTISTTGSAAASSSAPCARTCAPSTTTP
jgi:hypothetical protein